MEIVWIVYDLAGKIQRIAKDRATSRRRIQT